MLVMLSVATVPEPLLTVHVMLLGWVRIVAE
jgi:hypothetical protein